MNLEKPLRRLSMDDLPGCYSPNSIYWSKESETCRECSACDSCANGRNTSVLDFNANKALADSLPVKAGRVLNTLFKNNNAHAIRPSLLVGQNALKGKSPKFMSIALDELITQGGFSKRSLRGALVTQLDCKDETAFGWVSIAIPVLTALSAIKETHKYYRINYES